MGNFTIYLDGVGFVIPPLAYLSADFVDNSATGNCVLMITNDYYGDGVYGLGEVFFRQYFTRFITDSSANVLNSIATGVNVDALGGVCLNCESAPTVSVLPTPPFPDPDPIPTPPGPDPSPDDPTDDSSNTGMIVGLSVGLLLLILIVIGGYCWYKKRNSEVPEGAYSTDFSIGHRF